MTTALLVIDVQTTLCVGPWAVHDAAGLIDRINSVSRTARAAGAPVVFIQHEDDHPLMRHGSEGWQLAPGLETAEGDLFVRKTTPDSFFKTDLMGKLQARGVTALIVCGAQTDFCVSTTTLGALEHGLPVTLVSDGHSTLDNGVLTAPQIIAHHNRTLSNMDSFGVKVTLVPAAEVVVPPAA